MRASAAPTVVGLALGLSGPAIGAESVFQLSLQTPKIESLQTSITPTGGVVQVEIHFTYDTAGGSWFAGTVDGISVAGKSTIKSGPGGTTYKLNARGASVPPTVVSIAGTLGIGTASCNYSGPRGRVNVSANPVSIQSVKPVAAALRLNPVISDKNVIGGTARIEAGYTTNPVVAGTLKGKVSATSVSISIKHDKRSAVFSGQRVGNAYVGLLRLTVPPARETVTNFFLPLSEISAASGSALFRGSVTVLSNQLPTPAAGALITIRSDANGDGKLLGREVLTGVADKQGRYELSAGIVRGRPVMLEIRRPGFAEVLQAYPSIVPGATLTRNATLQPLSPLDIDGGSAESADGSIRLDGLPPTIESIQARVFNPSTDSAQFPGQFADNQGNLLVSSVFSNIEATDKSGRPVTALGDDTTLCMKVPVESWPSMGDLLPGNDRIDIPLYYYDENSGQWKRNAADGWLEDSLRNKITEDQLASIRDGSHLGEIFAAGPISHLSWWNIDWPIATHACIKGSILDTNGFAVAGASVSVFGLTYTGMSGPYSTAGDGAFALEIMRSEDLGEDVDGDGVTGETQQVQVKVQSGTNTYSFGPFNSPTISGSCSNGAGLNLGSLTLNDASRLSVSFCTVTGRVVYSGISIGGTPTTPAGGGLRFATVVGYDVDALDAAAGTCTNCLVTTTDSLGYFSLQMPVLSGATINVFANVGGFNGYGIFLGEMTTAGCPSGPVTIEADYTHFGTIPLILYSGSDAWGTATLQDNAIVVISYPVGTIFYVGSRNSVGLPFQTGPWFNMPMRNSTPGTFIGSIYFTVTSVFPPGGTWEMKDGSVNASGTWSSGFGIP